MASSILGKTKTTMRISCGFKITGKHVLFRELRHCMHSHEVKKKQGNPLPKRVNSKHACDTNCKAS